MMSFIRQKLFLRSSNVAFEAYRIIDHDILDRRSISAGLECRKMVPAHMAMYKETNNRNNIEAMWVELA